MSKSGNTPYVKVYKNGKITNEITKAKPYLHEFKSPRGLRKFKRKNNKKPLSDREKLSRLFIVEKVNRILASGKRVFRKFNFVRNPNTWLRNTI
jgi:hypothetical protein